MSRESLVDIDALWDFQHPDASERAFHNLLPAALSSGNATYHAELLTQIARAQGLQGHFDQAHTTLALAAQLLANAAPGAHIRYFLERGRVFHSSGDNSQARPAFVDAWELARKHGEAAYAIDAAHMLGIVEPLEDQLLWTERALGLAEETTDERARRWLGPLYNNLGWTYHDTGRYEEALDMFRRDVRFRHETGQIREARLARWAVGRTLRALEQYEEALRVQEALRNELECCGHEDGYVYEELGEILFATDQPDEARAYFRHAHALLSQDDWLAGHEPERLTRLRTLAETQPT